MGYVVAFNGNRDSYQVPLALYERGILRKLITDCYYPDAAVLRAIPGVNAISHRKVQGLPSKMTQSSPKALGLQVLRKLKVRSALSVFRSLDASLSRAALREAVATGSHLFLYSLYASEAFSSPLSRDMVKGLFVFHPHAALIRDILAEDFSAHPECTWSMQNERETAELQPRDARADDEWRMADIVVCASKFTAKSLMYAGCPASKIKVVPYGIDVPITNTADKRHADPCCRFLFVGQGVQRKGLHHLLAAWNKLSLPGAELIVVASSLDPGIAKAAGKNCVILGRQSSAELAQLFNSSHVFVMPSLVEGFGMVFLEALASGCFCIGSENTGLPDLNCPPEMASAVVPGNSEQLERTIASAYEMRARRQIDHSAIQEFAGSLKWSQFRESVADIAESLLPTGCDQSNAQINRNSAPTLQH